MTESEIFFDHINAELGPEGLNDALIAKTLADRAERNRRLGIPPAIYEVAEPPKDDII